MGYAKHFYVERALQNLNLSLSEAGSDAGLVTVFAAFVLKKKGMDSSAPLCQVLADESLPPAVKEFASAEEGQWPELSLSSFEKVSPEELKNYIIEKIELINESARNAGFVLNLPSSMNELNALILGIRPGDSVIDLGAGYGFFMIHVAK